MAETTNTTSSEDILNLNIEDLFAPLPEKTRLGGPGPFVINLSASSAPIDLPAKSTARFGNAYVYQMQRVEDGRPRYRLRLGPFTNEDEADAALPKVRDIFPGALTATADADDLRTIATLRAKAPAPQPVNTVIEAVAKSTAPVPIRTRAPVPAPAPRQAVPPGNRVTSLESTQTIRALTELELEDDQASRWFAIQLSLAEEPFDPETLPNLDIFSVYRLYSVAGIDNGRIVHALRLGFFTEQIAASAVASYLAAYYDNPAIKRVSAAERERFADQPLQARKDVGATGKQAEIEITNERYIREKRIGQAAGK